MAYFAPYIDAMGLHLPTYQDILDELIQQAKSIFGQDIYLGTDSQDYQWISVVAAKINDTLQGIQFAYDSHSPVTAIGSGLDTLVKLNGIKRNPQNLQAMYSTCVVTLGGTPGTVISNGVVQDKSNYKWNLPSGVTIGTGGTVDVTVTCQTAGPIYANPDDISIIVTPTYGWNTVTNANSAIPGVATEKDSQLKARQSISTSQPSRTVLEGTKGAIAAVSGVTRFRVYENDTNAVDANGLPEHSITAVAEGGADADIAQAIFNKKGPGCYTNGILLVNVTDQYGQVIPIRFYRPAYVDVDVVVNVKQLTGYTTETTSDIQAAIAAFLNGMAMGINDIPVNNFYGPALSVQNLASPSFTITTITAARHGEPQGTTDITTAFNEAVRGNTAYVIVNVT